MQSFNYPSIISDEHNEAEFIYAAPAAASETIDNSYNTIEKNDKTVLYDVLQTLDEWGITYLEDVDMAVLYTKIFVNGNCICVMEDGRFDDMKHCFIKKGVSMVHEIRGKEIRIYTGSSPTHIQPSADICRLLMEHVDRDLPSDSLDIKDGVADPLLVGSSNSSATDGKCSQFSQETLVLVRNLDIQHFDEEQLRIVFAPFSDSIISLTLNNDELDEKKIEAKILFKTIDIASASVKALDGKRFDRYKISVALVDMALVDKVGCRV